MHSCRDRSDDACALVARKPTYLAWVGPPSVGDESTWGCGASTQIRDPGSPTWVTWTRRVTRRHPVEPGRSRASLDRILQLATRAGPPLPPAIASARCSLSLREHVHRDATIFLFPTGRSESGRSPSSATSKDRGRMDEGLRARLRRAQGARASSFSWRLLPRVRRRRTFCSVFSTSWSELPDVKERERLFVAMNRDRAGASNESTRAGGGLSDCGYEDALGKKSRYKEIYATHPVTSIK